VPSPGQLPPSILAATALPGKAPSPQAPPNADRLPPSVEGSPLKRVKLESDGEHSEAGHLRRLLDVAADTEQGASFFDLCNASPSSADAAARKFVNLLGMFMEGSVAMSQAEPYGDIAIRRRGDWPAELGAVAA